MSYSKFFVILSIIKLPSDMGVVCGAPKQLQRKITDNTDHQKQHNNHEAFSSAARVTKLGHRDTRWSKCCWTQDCHKPSICKKNAISAKYNTVEHGKMRWKWKLAAQSCPTLCEPTDYSRQAPLSTEFSRQECWNGLPFPSPGDLPDPGIELRSPTLQVDSLPCEPPGKPQMRYDCILFFFFSLWF